MVFSCFLYHHLDSKRGPKSHLDTITWLHGQAAMLLLNTSISLESSHRSVGSMVGADGLRVPNIKVRFTLKERTWKEMRDGKECLNKNTIETQQSMKLIDWRFLQRITWLLLLLSSAPALFHWATGVLGKGMAWWPCMTWSQFHQKITGKHHLMTRRRITTWTQLREAFVQLFNLWLATSIHWQNNRLSLL